MNALLADVKCLASISYRIGHRGTADKKSITSDAEAKIVLEVLAVKATSNRDLGGLGGRRENGVQCGKALRGHDDAEPRTCYPGQVSGALGGHADAGPGAPLDAGA